ncbi:MAG: hypothetical protein ACXWC8_19725, partial [Limisphaerales bacterium]
ADGTFTGWGGAGVSPGITNVIAIADGNGNSLFLRSDGTVAAIPAGYTPLGLTKIVAIAAGAGNQNLALRSDGTVLEWGISLAGAGTTAITNPVPGLSNVVAIATGYSHCLALKSDGRVVTWGGRNAGLNLPPLLTNAAAPGVVAIAASGYPQGQGHSLAVLTNGTVIAWGDNPYGETNVPSGLTNVVAVAGGAYHSVALVNDGRPLILQSPVGGTAFTGRGFNFKAQVVGDAPLVYQWTFNGTNLPGATNALLTLTNVQGTNAGSYQLLVSNSIGNASSVPLPVKVVNSGPFLSTQPRSQTVCVGTRVGWSVPVGGSGPMYLHWRIATNAPQQPLGWRDLPGATNEDLVFDPVQVSDTGIYSLLASNALGSVTTTNVSLTVQQVVAWGDGGRTNVPANLTNVIAVSGGSSLYSYALRDDGTVAQWAYVSTNYSLPNFSNVVEISAGDTTSRAYALRSDGTVVGWNVSSAISNVLARLSGIVALESDAGGSTHLHPDGTITRFDTLGNTNVITGLANVVALSPNVNGFQALRADGTVFSYPLGSKAPLGRDVVSMAGAFNTGVFLQRDGTIVEWGGSGSAPFTNNIGIIAITSLGVKLSIRSDGVISTWGATGIASNVPSGLANLSVVDGGYNNFVGLCGAIELPPVFLPVALNTSNVVVSSRNAAQWFGQTSVMHDGSSAARSARIGSNTASSMRMLVTNGPVNVSFWWKVSSETNHDFLTLSLGGVPQMAISGEVDWQQVAFTVPAGPQMLVWTYSKDASGTAGMDAGFVDQLTFTPIAPTITSQPVSQTVLGGSAVFISAGVYGTLPLTYKWFKALNPVSTFSTLTINPAYRSASGTYYAIVTNSAGTATSSNAVLTVHVPQIIGLPLLQPDGTFTLSSQDADRSLFASNADFSGFQAQYSSNLIDWWPVLSPLSISNGMLQLSDTDATNAPVRFYRVIENW